MNKKLKKPVTFYTALVTYPDGMEVMCEPCKSEAMAYRMGHRAYNNILQATGVVVDSVQVVAITISEVMTVGQPIVTNRKGE